MAYSVVVRGTVYRAMCGNGNSLNLNSSGLKSVPEFVSRFPNLSVLLLCYNSISDLPTHFQSLCHVSLLLFLVICLANHKDRSSYYFGFYLQANRTEFGK